MPRALTACLSVSRSALAAASGRGERADHRGRMKAGLVDQLRRHEARAAHQLGADGDRLVDLASDQTFSLGQREDCRHDHGARVHRPAFERVVEVFAMRRGAVHERGAGGVERTRVADRGAPAFGLPAGERGAHIVGAARGDAQAADVEEEPLHRLVHGGG